MRTFLMRIPVPMAGLSLGLAALGNLLQSYSEGAHLLCGLSAAVVWLLVMAKIAFFPQAVWRDLRTNPIVASVFGTVFMTAMQLAVYAKPLLGQGAMAFWLAAVAGHGILILWFSVHYLPGLRLGNVYPTYFIAYVGIVVAAVTSPQFGMEALGLVLFRFGAAAYAVLFILVTARCLLRPMALAARPLICIYTAPMSLCLTGYLAVADPRSPLVPLAMGLAAQLLFLLVLCRLPMLLHLPFYPSYSAFTFPFVITAFGLQNLLLWLEGAGYVVPLALQGLLIAETVLAVGLVVYAFVRYMRHLACGLADAPALAFEECRWCCT